MSGRKQHFIPQILLRGFSREGKGAKNQVVVYTFDRGIFTAATDGIGAERNFYSELSVDGAALTLDDKITNFETSLADLLAGLRALSNADPVNALDASKLVAHLTIRNDHFRKSVSSGGVAMFDGFKTSMQEEQTAKALLGLAGNRPSVLFRDTMKKTIGENAPYFAALGLSEEQLIEWAYGYARANFSQFHRELISPMQAAFADFNETRILEIAADAQKRALDQDLSPEAWIAALSQMEWSVSDRPMSLILPDCVSLAFDESGKAQPLMLIDKDAISAVVVPISSHRLLIGSADSGVTLPEELNAHFAAFSWDFFVSNERSAEFEVLRGAIRSAAQELMGEIVTNALDDSMQSHSE